MPQRLHLHPALQEDVVPALTSTSPSAVSHRSWDSCGGRTPPPGPAILLPQSLEPWLYKLVSLGLAYHDSKAQNSHFHLLLTKQCPTGKGRFVTHPTSDVHPGYTESSEKLAGRERGKWQTNRLKRKVLPNLSARHKNQESVISTRKMG